LQRGGLETIRAVAIDVDGVLSGRRAFGGEPGGEEWKRFCFADIIGSFSGAPRRP